MPAVQTLIAAVSKLAPARALVGGQVGSPGATLRRSLVPAPESTYTRAGVEPPLEEVLGDPIVRALMRSDGVVPGEVRRVLEATRRRWPPE